MPSTETSSIVLDPDGGNEAASDPLALLASAKTELENVLKRAVRDVEQDPSLGETIARKALQCVQSLRDPLELDNNGFVDLIQRFFEFVGLVSSLFEHLRNKTAEDIKSLNGALDECIARGEKLVALDLRLNLDERFEEITDTVLKTCIIRQPHSKRNYVALIKIHNRLLEKVDEPVLRQDHVATLVHSMGREIQSSLTSERDQSYKLAAFLLKRTVYVSIKCHFHSDDPQYIRTLANLYELRLSDHPLNKLTERIELWKLVDFEGLPTVSTDPLGIGFVLLCCDVSESLLASQEKRSVLEFCIRTIYNHASDIVQFMFHRIRERPLFDHCLHILCQGLVLMGSSSVLDEIPSKTVSLEQQLLHDEVCRYFNRREMSPYDPVDDLASLGRSNLAQDRSEEGLRTFFEKAFQNIPMRPLSTPLEDTRVEPCTANSALLFSLISSFTPLTMTDFLAKASELAEIVTANPENDCLFLCACNFFTFARDFALCSVEDLSKQAPIVKLKEIVSRSNSDALMNAFGATSLIIFTFGTDLPRWLNLRSPSHGDFFGSFEKKFVADHWKSTLYFLRTGNVALRPPNTYVVPEEPTTDLPGGSEEPCGPGAVNQPLPELIHANILTLELRCFTHSNPLTPGEAEIIRSCILKLLTLMKRSR